MSNKTSIRELLVDIVKGCMAVPTIEEGVITKLDPLSITLVNDKKMKLSGVDLVLPSRLSEEGALEKGDRVNLLVYNNGKAYYVLDKV